MLTKLTRGNQIPIPKTIEVEERVAPKIFEKFQKQMLKESKGDVLVIEDEGEGFLSERAKATKRARRKKSSTRRHSLKPLITITNQKKGYFQTMKNGSILSLSFFLTFISFFRKLYRC